MKRKTHDFERLDRDNDGFVDFKEFVAMVAEIRVQNFGERERERARASASEQLARSLA